MKKVIILVLFLFVWTLLSAQITRQQADTIVLNYLQNKEIQPADSIYTYINEATEAGITITTSNGETFRAKYACWVYCLDENESTQRRYIFVKEENGNLLEVIASTDISMLDASWAEINILAVLDKSENSIKLLYPNPVSDMLTIPCNGKNTRVEIYDLKGVRLFSGENTCQLNVSFLNAGIYMVNVSGETYKIIKN